LRFAAIWHSPLLEAASIDGDSDGDLRAIFGYGIAAQRGSGKHFAATSAFGDLGRCVGGFPDAPDLRAARSGYFGFGELPDRLESSSCPQRMEHGRRLEEDLAADAERGDAGVASEALQELPVEAGSCDAVAAPDRDRLDPLDRSLAST
jgi:hypothetical protein